MKTSFVPDTLENKLILLFILDKMEIPLTETSILDICTNRNDWLNYMDCKDIMWQLQDVNFIYKTVDSENENRYNITIQGRECLSHFFNKIPNSLREEITEFAKNNRMQFKRSQEYVGRYVRNSDGTYTASLKIKDQLEGKNLFEIRIDLPTSKQAINACKNWKDKAPEIYEKIYDYADTIIENEPSPKPSIIDNFGEIDPNK